LWLEGYGRGEKTVITKYTKKKKGATEEKKRHSTEEESKPSFRKKKLAHPVFRQKKNWGE